MDSMKSWAGIEEGRSVMRVLVMCRGIFLAVLETALCWS